MVSIVLFCNSVALKQTYEFVSRDKDNPYVGNHIGEKFAKHKDCLSLQSVVAHRPACEMPHPKILGTPILLASCPHFQENTNDLTLIPAELMGESVKRRLSRIYSPHKMAGRMKWGGEEPLMPLELILGNAGHKCCPNINNNKKLLGCSHF